MCDVAEGLRGMPPPNTLLIPDSCCRFSYHGRIFPPPGYMTRICTDYGRIRAKYEHSTVDSNSVDAALMPHSYTGE